MGSAVFNENYPFVQSYFTEFLPHKFVCATFELKVLAWVPDESSFCDVGSLAVSVVQIPAETSKFRSCDAGTLQDVTRYCGSVGLSDDNIGRIGRNS